MRSELRNELDIKYEERFQNIREAAAAAIKQLDQLRSAGPMADRYSMLRSRASRRRCIPTVAILLFTGRMMASRVS
jgi:hypothetical protein